MGRSAEYHGVLCDIGARPLWLFFRKGAFQSFVLQGHTDAIMPGRRTAQIILMRLTGNVVGSTTRARP